MVAVARNRYCRAVQRTQGGSLSKHSGAPRRPAGGTSQMWLLAGVMAPTAWLLTGCGSGADLFSSVALPSQETASIAGSASDDLAVSPEASPQSGLLDVTPAQRGYLDALTAAGIHPSSELRALSIGSYVCQARAAGRNERAVWDYVAPMVRSDVSDARAADPQAATGPASDTAISAYIGAATQRLC